MLAEDQLLGFVDVGARGGFHGLAEAHKGQLVRVLVEPEAEEQARLASIYGNQANTLIVSVGLSDVDGELTFNETQNPTCSSVLPVNSEFVENYEIRPHFEFKKISNMRCARYDTLFSRGSLPPPNIIKADVQGYEYQVLQGFGDLLRETYVVELETHLYHLYQSQRLFSEVLGYLSNFDLVLRRIGNSRSPHLIGDPHFDGDLVELDVTFSKSRKWYNAQSPQVKSKFDLASQIMNLPHR